MSENDFRLKDDFWSHPKTVKLERRLGLLGPKHLQILWGWVAKNKPCGILDGMTEEDIEIAAQWPGEINSFVSVLVELRWLDAISDGSYGVHDWDDHQPYVAGRERRSNESRLSRMASTYSELYQLFRENGRRGISGEDYTRATGLYSKGGLTVVKREFFGSLTAEESENNASSTPAPEPVPVPEPSYSKSADAELPQKRKRKKPATAAPESMAVTDEMREYANAKGYHGNLEDETELFLNHHRGAGSLWSDWNSAWKKWIQIAVRKNKGGTVVSIATHKKKETRTCGGCAFFSNCAQKASRTASDTICDAGLYSPKGEGNEGKDAVGSTK